VPRHGKGKGNKSSETTKNTQQELLIGGGRNFFFFSGSKCKNTNKGERGRGPANGRKARASVMIESGVPWGGGGGGGAEGAREKESLFGPRACKPRAKHGARFRRLRRENMQH